MKTFKTNKDELFEIFLRNKIPAKNFTPIPHGNINEIYLVNSLYCNKYILRILNIKTLNNELFFYYKCSQLDIPVIKIFFSGRLKDNRDYNYALNKFN